MQTSTAAAGPAEPADLEARIAEAYVYAFAVHDLARTRWNATQNAANPNRFDVNTLSHARRLLDHRDRWITMPNNDTLYSIAWLDLSGGPVSLACPAMDERYFSFAFLDPGTDNVACVSRRTAGGEARTLWLAPPGWTGEAPAGNTPMHMASNELWLLGRVLVDGAADVPVGAFWSLSMYRMEPDGRGFFVDNPIGRYAIGDRGPVRDELAALRTGSGTAAAHVRAARGDARLSAPAHFTSTPTSHRLTPGNSSSTVVLSTSLIRNGTTPR